MTDNDNFSDPRPGGSAETTGSQKGQRRRGRRRSRRRGQSPQQAGSTNQTQADTPDSATPPGDKPAAGNDTPGRSRQRRRRSSRGGKSRNTQQDRTQQDRTQQDRTQQDRTQQDRTQQDRSQQDTAAAGSEQEPRQNRRSGAKNPPKGGNRGGNRNRRGQSTNRQRQGKGQGQGHHNRNTANNRSRHPDSSRMVTRDETSAGGLVMSGLAEAVSTDGSVDLSRIYVALIGRLDRRGRLLWSMPKGHVEPGEGHDATAEREVWEETGISGTVITELGVIDYWFVSDGVRVHKTVHHHLLRYADGDLNDEDPEVTEVAWIPASELIEHLAYADERKLARIAHDRLPDIARKEKAEGRATPR